MWKFIEKLRRLPERSRKVVVLLSSGGITAILLISWLVFPVPHFGALSEAEKERKNAENLAAPFSIIGGEIDNSFKGIKEKWKSFSGAAGSVLATTSTTTNSIAGEDASTTARSEQETTNGKQQEVVSSEGAITETSTEEPVASIQGTTTAEAGSY